MGVMWELFFVFKQKTAYEMRISDWSSDVCSSDLPARGPALVKAGCAVLGDMLQEAGQFGILYPRADRLGRTRRIVIMRANGGKVAQRDFHLLKTLVERRSELQPVIGPFDRGLEKDGPFAPPPTPPPPPPPPPPP